jgi:hypothetical protein
MKHFRLVVLVGLVTVFFIVGIAFAQGSGQGKGGQGAPMTGCQQRFESMDTNQDGKVTKEEFMAAPHGGGYPEQMFNAMDANKQGNLTKDQFCSGKGMGKGGMDQGMGRGMGQGMGTGTGQGQSTGTSQ